MKQVNAIGDACPLPVVKTKQALSEMEPGVLEVLVDNQTAVQNVQRLAQSSGYPYKVEQDGDTYKLLIEKTQGDGEAQAVPGDTIAGKTVVVLSADTMGNGDDELGRILLKGFVFALTQLDTLPDTVLLYNSGARLSVEDSPSLDDLISLEQAGVKIMTCGTCLNHFGIAGQLRVGEVTNMYSIVEELRTAGRILRP